MLLVTIQLIPQGNVENARTLATIEIANLGTGNAKIGNYAYHVVSDRRSASGCRATGLLVGWRRDRNLFPFIARILERMKHEMPEMYDAPWLDREAG